MIRKTIKGGDFKPQMVGELEFDQVPEEGSFNPVTSDGVAKAIDEAKEDMQEKIDEVTLDPSAVALGNVHLLDEVTEFPADGCILIDSETNGPGEMSKDTLLELTAQNAYKTNVAFKNLSSVLSQNVGAINTSGDIGSVVNLTPSVNEAWRYLVVDCTEGFIAKVKGLGGANNRLWCFVDEDNKILSHADQGADEVTYKTLVAPANSAKLIVNAASSAAATELGLLIGLVINEAYDDLKKNIDDNLSNVYDITLCNVDKTIELSQNVGAINTSGDIGSVVNLTPSVNEAWRYLVVDCTEGFIAKVKGLGGASTRLWCFIDSDNKILSHADQGADEVTYKTLIAPANSAKLIVNAASSAAATAFGIIINEPPTKTFETIDKTIGTDYVFLKSMGEDAGFKDNFNFLIVDNVPIGSVVNLTPVYNANWSHVVVDCNDFERFKVQGYGGGNSRLWCFIDADNKVLSKSDSGEIHNEPYLIVAPKNAKKLIVNSLVVRTETHLIRAQSHRNGIEWLSSMVDDIGMKVSDEELVEYNFDYNIPDFSSEVNATDFTDSGIKMMMEQIYSKLDDLITDYPDLITKVDAAQECNLSYPSYANGVPADDPDYLETPAYKTYMYKVSNVNVGAGNTSSCKKKKMLIVAGLHGYEVAAPFNTYLFIKMLVTGESSVFELFSSFDVYIVPCVNGYGIYHYQRKNANGVDINRNFPTTGWVVNGDPEDDTYSGPTAASEFETQLCVALVKKIKPDIYIDHHNYFDGADMQFYVEVCDRMLLHPVYQSLTNLSKKFIQNFPSVFGRKFRLFCDPDSFFAPRVALWSEGHNMYWGYQCGDTKVSATVEIGRNLCYINGVPAHGEDYSNTVFRVGYITLIDLLMRYAKTLYQPSLIADN